jgi:hypothetical protein
MQGIEELLVNEIARYDLHWCPLSEEVFKDSPGAIALCTVPLSKKISRDDLTVEAKCKTAWHDQVYPSATEMAGFYGSWASKYKKNRGDSQRAIQSLCFAIHMLQDLGVYHHVTGELLNGHSTFEDEALIKWKEYYIIDDVDERQRRMGADIVPEVKVNLKELDEEEYTGKKRYEKLGKKLVDITADRFKLKENGNTPSADVVESQKMTAQGIAAAIKAMSLYYRDETA